MGSPALENDLEVLLVLLIFSSYCIGIIPFFHGKNNFSEGLYCLFFWNWEEF